RPATTTIAGTACAPHPFTLCDEQFAKSDRRAARRRFACATRLVRLRAADILNTRSLFARFLRHVEADMDVAEFLDAVERLPFYDGQLAHVECLPARGGHFAEPSRPLPETLRRLLAARGVERLYSHQVDALEL